MTYFGFLLRYLFLPIVILMALLLFDRRRGIKRGNALRGWPVAAGIGLHVIVALIYTTPWDNYLVATKVWWYDPDLVSGLTLGWVPIEEYTFFIAQPILSGLWALFLSHRLTGHDRSPISGLSLRVSSLIVLVIGWIGSLLALLTGWRQGNYLALELAWGLPPLALQLAFGADILWRHRRLAIASILPTTVYLSLADALAIHSGTWTINPQQSLGLLLGGRLPLEEALFFLITNTLIVFGLLLIWSPESHARLDGIRKTLRARLTNRPARQDS